MAEQSDSSLNSPDLDNPSLDADHDAGTGGPSVDTDTGGRSGDTFNKNASGFLQKPGDKLSWRKSFITSQGQTMDLER